MRTIVIRLVISLFRGVIQRIVDAAVAWLLDHLRSRLNRYWLDLHARKQADRMRASRDREQAEAAGNQQAVWEASAREAAAERDANFAQACAAAFERLVENLSGELPMAVDAAVKAVAKGGKSGIARLIGKPSPNQQMIGTSSPS